MVITACTGSLAEALGIRGPVLTFTSGRSGALGALAFGRHLLGAGRVPGVVVVGTDVAADFLGGERPLAVADRVVGLRRWAHMADGCIAVVLRPGDADGQGLELGPVLLRRTTPVPGWGPPASITDLRAVARGLAGTRSESELEEVRLLCPFELPPEFARAAARVLGVPSATVDPVGRLAAVGAAGSLTPLVREEDTAPAPASGAVLTVDEVGTVGGYSWWRAH